MTPYGWDGSMNGLPPQFNGYMAEPETQGGLLQTGAFQPSGLLQGASFQPPQGLMGQPSYAPNPLSYQMGPWSQMAYQMAGSPRMGPYPSVPVPQGTGGMSTSAGGAVAAGGGGAALGILGMLARNPSLIKSAGNLVSNYLGGSASPAVLDAVNSAMTGTGAFGPAAMSALDAQTVSDLAPTLESQFASQIGSDTAANLAGLGAGTGAAAAGSGLVDLSPALDAISANATLPAGLLGSDAAGAGAADAAGAGAADAGAAGGAAAGGSLAGALAGLGIVGGIAAYGASTPPYTLGQPYYGRVNDLFNQTMSGGINDPSFMSNYDELVNAHGANTGSGSGAPLSSDQMAQLQAMYQQYLAQKMPWITGQPPAGPLGPGKARGGGGTTQSR